MVFVYKMKSRSSENIIDAKLFIYAKKQTPFYNSIVDIRRRIIFPKLCHGLLKIIGEGIHIFQVAQGTGFDILIRNYL